jgi:TPR repeat protein
MYYDGVVVDRNPAEAFKLYKLAADQGHHEAQQNIATMYYGR